MSATYRFNGKEMPGVRAVAAPMPPQDLLTRQHAWWGRFHCLALEGKLSPVLLGRMGMEVPLAANCACDDRWKELLAANPFRPAEQFPWSVEMHNAINADLGKPHLTVDQARALYPPAPAP